MRFSPFFVRIAGNFQSSFQVYLPLMVAVAGLVSFCLWSGLYAVNANRRFRAELARFFCLLHRFGGSEFLYFFGANCLIPFYCFAGWALAVIWWAGRLF